MKTTKLKTLYLVILTLIVASCLPQEKTTKCDTNEAYDSRTRSCIATLGAESTSINITNVTPSSSYAISKSDATRTHTVSISDPYNNGYQVRWNVILSDGTTTLLGTGLSITFNHTIYPEGSYILEVTVLNNDGTRVFDSRSWSVYIIDDIVPSLTKITSSPFTTTITSPATTITASANNPDAILGVNYQWYVNGNAIIGESGTFSTTVETINFSFDPTSASSYYAGSSVYTVQLVLTENGTGNIYDTTTWLITNNLPNLANVTLGSSTGLATTTPSTASIITTISDTAISSNGFLFDVDADSALDGIDFCVQVDDVNGVDGDGVFVDFLIDGTNIPGATNRQLTVVGDDYCLADYNDYSYSLPTNIVQESHLISAVVYDKYTGGTSNARYNGYTQLEKYDWTIRVRQKNSPPTILIQGAPLLSDGATPNPISCTGGTSTFSSGCTITQDQTFRLEVTLTDDDFLETDYNEFKVEFFLDNILLDGSHPYASHNLPPAAMPNCTFDYSDNPTTAGPPLTDKFVCEVSVNSYDVNGPIDVSGLTYNFYAKVTDTGATPYGGTARESNLVYWNVSTVNEANTAPTIDAFQEAVNTTSYISLQSAPTIPIQLTSGGGARTAQEGDIIQFNIDVQDAERDSFNVKIQRCRDTAAVDASCNNVIASTVANVVVNSNSAVNPKTVVINHQIAEDAVDEDQMDLTGDAYGEVRYRIIVEDPTTPALSAQTVVGLNVNNTNPDPVFNTANFNPSVATSLVGFSGFPITIDPGAITDASITDGEVISYQWQYLVDTDDDDDFTDEGAYQSIDGAMERVLTWIPSPTIGNYDSATNNYDGVKVKLRLCLGDDGRNATGSPKTNDCSTAALDTSGNNPANAWELTVFSNMTQGKTYDDNTFNNVSYGQVATWVDPRSKDPVITYMAYVSFARELVIEKIITNINGTKEGSVVKQSNPAVTVESIKFNISTDLNFSTNDITNLSMTGDPDTTDSDGIDEAALYISYMTPISGVDQVHIRRIDISGGKTGFTHDGKFGWDPGYNDLTDNIVVTSAGIDPETVNGDGQIELNFTDTAANTGMSVTFSGIMGSSTTLTSGTHFCVPVSGCTTINDTASEFANAVNASTEAELQGITATNVAGVVTLEGIVEGDYLELDVGATSIGQIMVNSSAGKLQWQLPLIDHDLSGGDKNKISMLEGDLGVRLVDANATKSFLSNTAQAQEIANSMDGNFNVILAIKELGSGQINAYHYDEDLNALDSDTDIFDDNSINNIKVAATKETTDFFPYVFITGTNASNTLSLARFDSTNATSNYIIDKTLSQVANPLDSGFSLIQNLNNYAISAGANDNQLLMTVMADPDGNTTYEAYFLNVKGAVPKIDCSYDNSQAYSKCQPIFTTTTSGQVFNLPVAMGDVLKDVTIGTDGANANEATNHLMPILFHIDDGGGIPSNDAIPISGLINSSDITVTSDENNTGAAHILPYVSP